MHSASLVEDLDVNAGAVRPGKFLENRGKMEFFVKIVFWGSVFITALRLRSLSIGTWGMKMGCEYYVIKAIMSAAFAIWAAFLIWGR